MIRQTLRPITRASRTVAQNARAYSSSSSPPQSGNPLIVPLGVAAIAIGGAAYFFVPLKHDLADRAKDAEQGVAKPSTLKALTTQPDVRKSVLDQDSLKESIHKPKAPAAATSAKTDKADKVPETIEKKAEEASQPAQTAFNEETGEINWDCPCLGGMADGPCGEQFKAAFSCFIYSEEEPKGVDCVEKFKHMQDCFREHPEIYGEEIDDDEDDSSATATDATPSSDSWKPDSQKNRKLEISGTPPANLPHHSATTENSVKAGPKIAATHKRIDKAPGGGPAPPIGEGTVPKPFGGDSPREGK